MANIHQVTEVEGRKPWSYNVEWMTRVTGYMSKVSGWNKGKLAELEDRHRENDTQSDTTSRMGWYDG